MVLSVVNLLSSRAHVKLAGIGATPRTEYIMEAANLTSSDAALNGMALHAAADHTLPDVLAWGKHVATPADGPLLPPRSYGFVLLAEAQAPGCKGRQ